MLTYLTGSFLTIIVVAVFGYILTLRLSWTDIKTFILAGLIILPLLSWLGFMFVVWWLFLLTQLFWRKDEKSHHTTNKQPIVTGKQIGRAHV